MFAAFTAAGAILLLVTAPSASIAAVMVLDGKLLASAAVPALGAYSAYGEAVSDWRGERMLKSLAPLVRAAISSQRASPLNTPVPKSSVTVKRPLLTAMAELVSMGPCCVPRVSAS
jgi:hypothetical protein